LRCGVDAVGAALVATARVSVRKGDLGRADVLLAEANRFGYLADTMRVARDELSQQGSPTLKYAPRLNPASNSLQSDEVRIAFDLQD
jgi:hypothetical protein